MKKVDAEKKVAWERWQDPFDIPNDEEEESFGESIPYEDSKRPMKGVVTQMGVMPITEYSMPSRVFNFWIGHTNFSINKDIHKIIDNIEGVETLDVFTRYRFRIGIGKLFRSIDVRRAIDKGLHDYHDAKDKKIDIKDEQGSPTANIKDLLRGTYGKKA